LIGAPILSYPSQEGTFILDCDASANNIGAVLSQVQNNGEKVISYASRTMTKSEKNYCVAKKEMLALVFFVKKLRHYLLGKQFRVRTDHKALAWLWSFKEPEDQIARWQAYLAEFDMEIVHRKGFSHGYADSMSRRPNRTSIQLQDDDIIEGGAFCNVVESNGKFDWKKAQSKDCNLEQIIKMKADTVSPIVRDDHSTVMKRLIGQWENILVKDGVLYRKFEKDSGDVQLQFVVPANMQKKLVKELHAGVGGGHLGVKKTSLKVKDRFYWSDWSQDVEICCAECVACASKKNPTKLPRAPLVSIKTGAPLEKVALDILGPLPKTSRGNQYIVVISDYFTKWTEAYPLRNHKAKTIAKKLVEEFICRSELHIRY